MEVLTLPIVMNKKIKMDKEASEKDIASKVSIFSLGKCFYMGGLFKELGNVTGKDLLFYSFFPLAFFL